YSSMYQDIVGGRLTEVDYINGAIVRLGEKHGIPTPVNRMIVNLTHFKEELR
ncbi:MAG TPA: 2-dehydropantoate 2-reductase, partial [Methanocorpusculum sp.]|nr:2-dehydropantoate 2-reductase [Methanocorpusculum sp.]